MEFLRFGSSIPGGYWGCCAMDIIQDFKQDPDQKASIQLVSGDGGSPVFFPGGKVAFAGPTYKDIFLQRIRFGTFDNRDMPNHGFLAILTDWQINSDLGRKWLKILKETGFEFIRTVSNSVYDGQSLGRHNSGKGGHPNYLFGLFRNIGVGNVGDPFMPPKAWSDLPEVVPEPWRTMSDTKTMAKRQHEIQTSIWKSIGPAELLSEEDVVKAGAPVVLAGLRSEFPQQPKEVRENLQAQKAKASGKVANPDPFGKGAKAA